MINVKVHGFLISFVLALMGFVHSCFAFLSSTLFQDNTSQFFAPSGLILLVVAAILGLSCHRFDQQNISHRDAFLFAVTTWFSLGMAGKVGDGDQFYRCGLRVDKCNHHHGRNCVLVSLVTIFSLSAIQVYGF